ncbi:MAG: NfeD family protein [Chitinophagaceae bacterium]|nr:NfeD family protein [Chitinophagaceae bacterium]
MVLLDISSWWQSMAMFEKIFWVIALLFSLMFLVQVVLSFAAGDGDVSAGDADDYIGHDDGIGYQFFTIKNLIAFFTIFGWTGIACIKGGMGKGITILLALVAGSLMVVMMAFLFRSMSRLRQSGTLQIKNAIGLIGETYLFIPALRGGFGKVHIKVQGSLHELQAMTDDEQQIATGKLVKVVDVINDSTLVVTSKLS